MFYIPDHGSKSYYLGIALVRDEQRYVVSISQIHIFVSNRMGRVVIIDDESVREHAVLRDTTLQRKLSPRIVRSLILAFLSSRKSQRSFSITTGRPRCKILF